MKAAKLSTQPAAPKPNAVPPFRPIILHSGQSFSGAGTSSDNSGVIFSGHTAQLGDFDKALQCGGSYCLRNSQHTGSAGLTDDGRVIFSVTSRINGRDTTVIGAFDQSGQPSPPTDKEVKLLDKIVPSAKSRLVLDTKTRSDLGVKLNGDNATAAMYADRNTIKFNVSYLHQFDNKTSLGVDAAATADYKTRQVLSRSIGVSGKSGDLSGRVAFEQAGLTRTGTAEVRSGKLFGNVKYATDGTNQNREYNFGADINKSTTLTVTLRPDYQMPKTAAAPSFKFDPMKPDPIPDHSNAKIELKITF
ncbi:hypothetical protein [Endobacterium cereale]|jgi:hypothetical protein|nr:hypothetical protein [Endobacterium cereale]MEB2845584.1 hypothetical protein [Endobacterium cereale]